MSFINPITDLNLTESIDSSYRSAISKDNGVLKDMIPEFGVSMASKGNHRKYGRIINLKDPIPPTDRISYEARETKAIKVETETKVMLVPNDVSAFVTADVEGV